MNRRMGWALAFLLGAVLGAAGVWAWLRTPPEPSSTPAPERTPAAPIASADPWPQAVPGLKRIQQPQGGPVLSIHDSPDPNLAAFVMLTPRGRSITVLDREMKNKYGWLPATKGPFVASASRLVAWSPADKRLYSVHGPLPDPAVQGPLRSQSTDPLYADPAAAGDTLYVGEAIFGRPEGPGQPWQMPELVRLDGFPGRTWCMDATAAGVELIVQRPDAAWGTVEVRTYPHSAPAAVRGVDLRIAGAPPQTVEHPQWLAGRQELWFITHRPGKTELGERWLAMADLRTSPAEVKLIRQDVHRFCWDAAGKRIAWLSAAANSANWFSSVEFACLLADHDAIDDASVIATLTAEYHHNPPFPAGLSTDGKRLYLIAPAPDPDPRGGPWITQAYELPLPAD